MPDLILESTTNHVTTLVMNHPARLNGWTAEMMAALKEAMRRAAAAEETKVVILTGADPYYCAGVNLSGTLRPMHPKKLRAMIIEHNQALFESFLRFEKPILAAINGPAIGASVTSATLCDGMIASTKATFSTPFGAVKVAPEGCSSVHFERLLGVHAAARMLGPEGWKPNAEEAKEAGLVQWVVEHDRLLPEAQKIAEGWVEEGKGRAFRGGSTLEELLEVNARESVEVADSFLSRPFFENQARFLWKKRKRGPAVAFAALALSHPLWSKMLG